MIPGATNEIQFWQNFVTTDRFKEWCKDEPNAELGPFITHFIQKHIPADGKILDCGSGVVSILHGLGYDLTSTDVLGAEYKKLYPECNVIPIAAENITYWKEFDIVHMRNALDHCQDPARAYKSMLHAVKPGGHLIIHGFENEATAENWKGMHQWDISVRDNELVMQGATGEYRFDGALFTETVTLPNNKRWMTFIVKK